MIVVFFLEKDISKENIDLIQEEFEKSPLLAKFQFISPQKAQEKFIEKFPELEGVVNTLNINPFPPSYEVTLKENVSTQQAQSFIQKIKKIDSVQDIQYNQSWVDKMQSLSRLAQAVGFFMGGILILASFFIISNVIKLNVMWRKEEIEILRLVGATNSFIRLPFLAEGIILGIGGGILSLLLLFLVIKFFPLYLGSSLGALTEIINFRFLSLFQCLMIILFGALIGFLGSISSTAKFLKT